MPTLPSLQHDIEPWAAAASGAALVFLLALLTMSAVPRRRRPLLDE